LHMDKDCYGIDLRNYDIEKLRKSKRVNIQWMKDMYEAYPYKYKFFDRSQSSSMGNIDFLAGDANFKNQIIAGTSVEDIQASWEPGLSKYKEMRKKYLLYK
ncbi:hypothetical protein, partial [Pseudomonas aeruginosa]|uniref:hypothetical protein n=1 Tax=Pseudomonas aeruginosa TaxID=287 RepID=UPI002F3FCCF3